MFLTLGLAFCAVTTSAQNLPSQPADPHHPGSNIYPYTLFHEVVTLGGRQVEFFAPAEIRDQKSKVPMIAFGHGQALGADNYRLTFEHLAKKGVAVMHPMYDTGFFDRNWQRMGQDFAALTGLAAKRYAQFVNSEQIIYSGHSKGGYVALVAAGVISNAQRLLPAAIIVFEPAGFESENLKRIDPTVPVTVTFSDADTVIKESLVRDIYMRLPSTHKQYIHVVSYTGTTPELPADHFFPQTKSAIFGGRDGVSPFHYYGVWKWLLGAADALQNIEGTDAYLYGSEAASTGVDRLRHKIERNF